MTYSVKIWQFTLLAGCALLSAAAAAQEMPVPLKELEADGGTVEYIGHAWGTDGWRVTRRDGDPLYAYVTPEGGIIVGMLLRPDGTSETQAQLIALKEKLEGGQAAIPGVEQAKSPAATKVERLYASVERAGWARVGNASAPYIYMFVNTTCGHCQDFWRKLQDPVRAGQLQVRLVPFGQQELNRTSGAALLSAADPAAAWEAFIRGDESALGADKVKDGMLARVDVNTALFRDWKMSGPPFTIYRKPADGVVTALVGVPDNTLVLLADLIRN